MTFQVLHSSKINSKKWNQRILSNQSDIYNEYHYLSAITNDDWYGIIWGDYEKLLPFYQKKKLGILPYVTMPPFCQKFDSSHLSAEEFGDVIDYLKTKNILIEYRVNDCKGFEEFEEKQNYKLSKNGKQYYDISANYSSMLKKNLQKSKELVISSTFEEKELDKFLKTNQLFKSLITEKYKTEFQTLISRKYLKKYIAKVEEEICAILFVVIHNQKSYLIFPYTSDLGKSHQAMSRLIDHHISMTDTDIIDFEGSSIESIAKFYQQFGSELEEYFSLKWKKYNFPNLFIK